VYRLILVIAAFGIVTACNGSSSGPSAPFVPDPGPRDSVRIQTSLRDLVAQSSTGVLALDMKSSGGAE
jgi:hypothetical protein